MLRMKFNIYNSPYYHFIILLYVFLLWSIIVTIFAPNLYEGMHVYNPRIGMDDQFNNLSKLSLSYGNLSQIIYIIINTYFLAFAIIYSNSINEKLLINSYIYSGIIVIIFSYWQKISITSGIYYPNEILYSNLSLEQVRISNLRLSSTFSEPSLLNGFMVPFLFFIYKYSDINRYIKSILLLSVIIILIWSESSTGILSIILIASFVCLCNLILIYKKRKIQSHYLIKYAFFIISSLIVVAYGYDFIIKNLFEKADTLSAVYRFAADKHSLNLLVDTYGVGVGLGSNRPSSFLTFLISTLGIVGLIIFFILIYVQIKISLRIFYYYPKIIPFIFLFISTLIPMFIGIPDIDFQMLWINWGLLACMTSIGYKNFKTLPAKNF